MDAKTQAAVNEIIQVMQTRETELRQAMVDASAAFTKDPLRPGLATQVEFIRTQTSGEDARNTCSCTFEMETFFAPAINRALSKKEDASLDLGFLTKEMFDNDVVPAVRSWMQNKVDNEVFGGLYAANLSVYCKLKTDRLPEDKTKGLEATLLTNISSEKRIAQQKEKMCAFVKKEGYKKAVLADIGPYIEEIYTLAAGDAFEEIGKQHLLPMSQAFIIKAGKPTAYSLEVGGVTSGLTKAAQLLIKSEKGQPPTDEKLFLAYQLCTLLLNDKKLNAEFKWRSEYDAAQECLMEAARQGQEGAALYLGLGTKRPAEEVLREAEAWVACKAYAQSATENATVDFNIKEENAKAYVAMVTFLNELLKKGFPYEYKITFNSQVKKFVPVDLSKTNTNNFFANAAQYPEAYGALREYAATAFEKRDKYYADAGGEDMVPCGGYAAMAMGFANPEKNFGLAMALVFNTDLGHVPAVRCFIQAFAKVCKGGNKKELKKYIAQFE